MRYKACNAERCTDLLTGARWIPRLLNEGNESGHTQAPPKVGLDEVVLQLPVPALDTTKQCTVKRLDYVCSVTWEEDNGNSGLLAHSQTCHSKMCP